jgi:hypothetical protein
MKDFPIQYLSLGILIINIFTAFSFNNNFK